MANQWGDGELRFLKIDATADGVNALISAAAGVKIKVISYVITATGAGVCIFEDTDGTDLSPFSLAANGGVSYAGSYEAPAFQTALGKGLQLNNAASQDIKGHLTYLALDR